MTGQDRNQGQGLDRVRASLGILGTALADTLRDLRNRAGRTISLLRGYGGRELAGTQCQSAGCDHDAVTLHTYGSGPSRSIHVCRRHSLLFTTIQNLVHRRSRRMP